MLETVSVTVSQLNRYIKSVMDSDYNLRTVFVSGEISNFTNHYRTGHFYMTLKDEKAAVRAVMFKYDNERLGFMPENGMKVIARGRVSVFERDGQYQLYIEDMQPDGAGALSIAFEQLKKKLEAEGAFCTGSANARYRASRSVSASSLRRRALRIQGHYKCHNAPQPVNADNPLSRAGAGRVRGGSDIRCYKAVQRGALCPMCS